MTRENKLALVVGFALILFIGILISDHFSVAKNEVSANLSQGISDPLIQISGDNPDLIEYDILANTGRIPAKENKSSDHPETVYMGRSKPQAIGLSETQTDTTPFFFHEIKPGESLSSIAAKYFGDPSFSVELAAFNNITDPNRVSSGRRIRVPKIYDLLIRGNQSHTPAPLVENSISPVPQKPQYATYTIKPGDMLSRLSQKLLGTSKRMHELIELNRDVIKNPDRLMPGTVIKVPRK